ncbi:MAG: ATP-dependent DNA ligase, partial [Thermoplasmata archaeon]|nr:ATP-dependent DNA ligase [Thermoplasmata archaeon]
SGPKSRQRKASVLNGLMMNASKVERDFLIDCVTGDIRSGFSEGLMIETIAKISQKEPKEVIASLGVIGDIGRVAEAFIVRNEEAESAKVRPMHPLRLMLAESADSIEESFELIQSPINFEYKLDGIRVQIHGDGKKIRIFSRRQIEITGAFPEIINDVRRIKANSYILDGEVVAFGKKPLPFQEVMRRVTREKKVAIEAKQTPVRLFLFDVLHLDGRSLIDSDYELRTKILEDIVPANLLVSKITTTSKVEAEKFFAKSLSEGHEGLVAKNLHGKYHLGRRSRDWIKIKEHITIDAVIIAAEWGHGRRSNWLSNYHLGVRKADGFAMVGKTFKGVSDDELKLITDRLLMSVIEDHGSWVKVEPSIVVEIAFNEIQRSPKYESGMALRFARVQRIRDDKGPEEAITEEQLRLLMERQFVSKEKRPR